MASRSVRRTWSSSRGEHDAAGGEVGGEFQDGAGDVGGGCDAVEEGNDDVGETPSDEPGDGGEDPAVGACGGAQEEIGCDRKRGWTAQRRRRCPDTAGRA